jgi:hypothetical protein
MLKAGAKATAIAKELKRTVGAVYARRKALNAVDEFQLAAKSPDSKIDVAAQPLPPGGSTKTATLPRLGNSPHQVDRLRAVFLFEFQI